MDEGLQGRLLGLAPKSTLTGDLHGGDCGQDGGLHGEWGVSVMTPACEATALYRQ